MRKIFLFVSFFMFITFVFAQTDKHVLNFDGMDELKIGISKQNLEKLINKKIVYKHIGIDVQRTETVSGSYKGIDFDLDMMGSDAKDGFLDGISTTSPLFKTAEGIGIGSDQSSIISAYEKHLLIISKEIITLVDIDNLDASIVFYMQNKKVVKIGVEPTAQFRDRE